MNLKYLREFIWLCKSHNRFGAVNVLSFRVAHFFCEGSKFRYLIGTPIIILYHIIFRHIIGFDVHEKTEIGDFFCPYHCFGIAINPNVKIGKFVSVCHNTTLGCKDNKSPIIEDFVTISPSVCIVGDLVVGHHSIVGIGAIVTKDIPSYSVVAGNPAKVIKFLN